jgi:LemA protein
MRMEWIIFAAVIAVGLGGIVIYNGLVRLRNMVREAWSGIDVQLKRRTDLIPNLVATVKAYAAHERGLFEDIVARRNASLAAASVPSQAAAERALQGTLTRLLAVAEAYPQLKSDENFRALADALTEIEDQLQMARRYYNGSVRDLNIAIQSFPQLLLARPLGFREQPFFELDDAADANVPQVSLGGGAA